MNFRALRTTGLALIFGLGFSGLASAQPQQGGQPPQGGGQPPAAGQQQPPVETDFSDSELQSFVDVQGDLQAVRQEYTELLEATEDPAEAQSLQEEASQEMVEVLESSELNVETYNQIAMALQQDQELLERVQEMMN